MSFCRQWCCRCCQYLWFCVPAPCCMSFCRQWCCRCCQYLWCCVPSPCCLPGACCNNESCEVGLNAAWLVVFVLAALAAAGVHGTAIALPTAGVVPAQGECAQDFALIMYLTGWLGLLAIL